MTHNFKLGDMVIFDDPDSTFLVTGIKSNTVEITGDFSGIGACVQSDWIDASRLTKCKPKMTTELKVKWNKSEEYLPEQGVEVIGFHPDWIDEDFNPQGVRVCFINDDGNWWQAWWVDYQDSYETYITESGPSYWVPKPNKPQI